MDAWLPILIIILVIALAVGPVMLMQPTPQQKRLATLRGKAAAQGLIISLPAWPEKTATKPTGFMRYIAPWQTNDRAKQNCLLFYRDYPHELHVAEHWQIFPKEENVPEPIVTTVTKGLPQSVKAIGCGPQGVYVDWNENKSTEFVLIAELITNLRNQLQRV